MLYQLFLRSVDFSKIFTMFPLDHLHKTAYTTNCAAAVQMKQKLRCSE